MQFMINPDKLNRRVSELDNIEGELRNIASGLENIISMNAIQMGSYNQVRRALRNTRQNIGVLSENTAQMNAGLQNAINEYKTHEQSICEHARYGEGNGVTVSESKGVDWMSLLWKGVGTAGAVGKGVSTIGKFLTGDKTAAAWAGLVSGGWSTGWKIGKAVKKCTGNADVKWYKEIFGFNKDSFLKSIKTSNLSPSQKAYHGVGKGIKGTLREFKTSAGAAKQVGGIILSGITNAISNYEEFGEFTGRAAAETFMETVVDWGKDLLIGAGVTAAFAAAGVAAPAIAVGAATVAISVGVDWISEKVFGKKLTETVSDAILDGAEWAVDKVKTGAKKVGEGVRTLWNNIAGGWNRANAKPAMAGGGVW